MITDTIFATAMELVFEHEGGFQCDRNDPGNWTGGKVGIGVLKGTKYGISAAQYPALPIALLTPDQAKQIYYQDYWIKYHINELPGVLLPTKVLDTEVLAGGWATILLQRALNALGCALAEDGMIGPKTVQACQAASLDGLLARYDEMLVQHFEQIVATHPSEQRFLAGWEARALELPKIA